MSIGFDLDEDEFFIFIILVSITIFVSESIIFIVEIPLWGQTPLLRH